MLRFLLFLSLFSYASQAQTPLFTGTYTDSLPPSATCTYLVSGDVTLQGKHDLNGVQFLFKSDFRRDKMLPPRVFGANIRLCGARVKLENCTLAAADSGMWGGIYLADSSSKLQLLQCQIQDSYHGIVQNDSLSQIIAQGTAFNNNYTSLQLSGKRDTIRHCVFMSKPSGMKQPFDSLSANDYYYSAAHIKNTENKQLYLYDKQFFLNLFLNALYGVYVNKKHMIAIQESYFIGHKIAAIYHQNGDLQLTNQNEIHLPTQQENTIQMQTERRKQQIPDSVVYGIYARNGRDDIIADETNIRSTANIPVAGGTTLPFNHVGYHGQNGVNVTFQYQNLNSTTGHPNGISNMRVGISLLDHGTATVVATGLVNNQVAILTERSTAGAINLQMNCNEFVRTAAMQNVPCVGLRINGQGSTMNQLGGCPSEGRSPSGNEIMDVLGLGTNPNADGAFTNVPNPNFFNFIENNTGNLLNYFHYKNENVGLVTNIGVNINRCPDLQQTDGDIADINTCFARIGIQDRMANPNAVTSLPAVNPKAVAVLGQNTPNPTTLEGTAIAYELPEGVKQAELIIRNSVGVVVRTERLLLNENSVHINTSRWATGLYSYSLIVDGQLIKTRKMAVVQ